MAPDSLTRDAQPLTCGSLALPGRNFDSGRANTRHLDHLNESWHEVVNARHHDCDIKHPSFCLQDQVHSQRHVNTFLNWSPNGPCGWVPQREGCNASPSVAPLASVPLSRHERVPFAQNIRHAAIDVDCRKSTPILHKSDEVLREYHRIKQSNAPSWTTILERRCGPKARVLEVDRETRGPRGSGFT